MIHFRIFVHRQARALCAKPTCEVLEPSSPDPYKVTCPLCKAVLKEQRAS